MAIIEDSLILEKKGGRGIGRTVPIIKTPGRTH